MALVMALTLSLVCTAQAFAFGVRVENPDAAYLARTTKADLSGLPDSGITSVTAGDVKVTFDRSLSRTLWAFGDVWGSAGEVEDPGPTFLSSEGHSNLSMQASRSVMEFGAEVTPTSWGAFDVVATFVFSEDGETVGQVTQTIDAESSSANWGARLFALRSDVPFDRVDMTVSGGGLLVSQIRYGDALPATVSGTVKSAAGVPVPFATVSVEHDGAFATRIKADHLGRYSVKLVPATYTFYVGGPGWDQVTEDFTVPESTATKDFTLTDHYEQAVYRFFNMKAGVHFYTANDAEFINTRTNLADTFTYDGVAYYVRLMGAQDTVPLYRFYNPDRGVHFYTASEAEKNDVIQNHSDIYVFEGVAYGVRIDGVGIPVHRYYVPSRNTHFYTTDTSEISLKSGLSKTYRYEGIGYWVGGSVPD